MAGVEGILTDKKEDPVENAIEAIEAWILKLEQIERKLRAQAAGL